MPRLNSCFAGLIGALALLVVSIFAVNGCGKAGPPVTPPPGGPKYFAFVGDRTTGNIYQFSIGSTGALSALSPAFATGGGHCMAVTPDGNFLYSLSGSNQIYQYAVDGTGQLSALSVPAVSSGNGNYYMAITPDQKHAYVSNVTDGTVSQYSITDGLLNPLTPAIVSGITGPYLIAIAPSGKYAYVASYAGGKIYQFSISATGTLVALTPATVTPANAPFSVVVSNDSKYLYAGDSPGDIYQYSIGATGVLTALAPASVTAGVGTAEMAISPNNYYLYAADFNSGTNNSPIYQYSLSGTTGALTALSPTHVTTGNAPQAIKVSPDGKYVYAAMGNDGNVWQLSVGSGGTLTALTPNFVSITGATSLQDLVIVTK
jgi:6-phosphogluconolactonase (cycloisomerase 2 family)